jgi:hypothetical protein
VRREAEGLHPVGELVLDHVGDEPGQRVLPDEADHVREVPRPVVPGVPTVDEHPAGQGAPGEVRHQTVEHPQQGGLAGAGPAHHQRELALGHRQAHAVEHRGVGVGEGDADRVELDHAATSIRGSSTAASGSPAGSGGAR